MKSYTADGQHNAVNFGLWSRVTPWARCVEDDLEFAKLGKYSSQAGQAKVSEGREDWSLLLELKLRNVITMRPGRDIRLPDWATYCVLARAHLPSRGRTMA